MKNLDPPCPKCARPLAQRAYDKCMYCGAALPTELRLSDAEKEEHRQRLRQSVEADKRQDALKRDRSGHVSHAGGGGGGALDALATAAGIAAATKC